MNYTQLKAGDVRCNGDEQRQKQTGCKKGYHNNWDEGPSPMRGPGGWEQTCLVGHPILASDLMHLEFRRGE